MWRLEGRRKAGGRELELSEKRGEKFNGISKEKRVQIAMLKGGQREKRHICSDSPSRYVRATNLRISSMRMTGKESFSTMTHCSVFKCVSLKIICGPEKKEEEEKGQSKEPKTDLSSRTVCRRRGELAACGASVSFRRTDIRLAPLAASGVYK